MMKKAFITFSIGLIVASPLFAMAPPADGQSQSIFVQLLPLALIFVIFFFLVIRPQQKKIKKHRELLGALKKGDEVITSSGIYGKISKVNDTDSEVSLEIADKVVISITKESVSRVLGPAKNKKEANNDKKAKAAKSKSEK